MICLIKVPVILKLVYEENFFCQRTKPMAFSHSFTAATAFGRLLLSVDQNMVFQMTFPQVSVSLFPHQQISGYDMIICILTWMAD